MLIDRTQVDPGAGSATQRVCAWCGPSVVVICVVGLAVCAGFVPPPSASWDPARLAAVYAGHPTGIRLGMMLMVIGGALLGAFFAAISAQLRRIEGPRPTLTYLQLLFGACFVMEIIFPVMAIQTAAYRPGRLDVAQQMLNDFGWLAFFGIASTGVVQMAVIGVAILQDTRQQPVFPRWAGYFNIWVGLMYAPGTVVVFFKTGPLAWTGLFVFWLPFAAFFAWLVVMTALLLKAVRHESGELAAGRRAGDPLEVLRERVDRLTAEVALLRSHPDAAADRSVG